MYLRKCFQTRLGLALERDAALRVIISDLLCHLLHRCSMSEEDGAKLYDVYPHVSDSVRSHLTDFPRWHPNYFEAYHVQACSGNKVKILCGLTNMELPLFGPNCMVTTWFVHHRR